MSYIESAKNIFNIEIEALKNVRDSLDDNFVQIVDLIVNCSGKVIMTGMGKPGHIARKIAATMASLGTPSFFLHPAEALHGDLGMVSKNDIIMAISYSGESEEVVRLLPNIKAIGATLVGISGNPESTLIRHSDYFQLLSDIKEACNLGLAPTSSTTAALVLGDALAVIASEVYGFTESNYGLYHPAGSLGKRLFLRLSDIMVEEDKNSVVKSGDTLKNAIVEMGKGGLGIITIIDNNHQVLGVVTDGDLRRQLEKGVDVYGLIVDDIMSTTPTVFDENMMAVEALQILKDRKISSAPIINFKKELIGTVRIQDILNAGIVL